MNWLKDLPPPDKITRPIRVTRGLMDALAKLLPGRIYRLDDKQRHRQYAVVEYEDFKHICELAGLTPK